MTQKDWNRIALGLVILAVLIVALLVTIIYSPEEEPTTEDRLVQAEAALEKCRDERDECRAANTELAAQLEDCSAELEACLSPQSSSLEVEKWVKSSGSCCWQKEISASKGSWLEFRILVTVTGTLEDVRVKDPTLTGDPWTRIQGLKVDNVSTSGNIMSGISLGTLENETREITFQVLLCSQDSQYQCGTNTLINTVEVMAECGYRATSSATVKTDIVCPPVRRPCCRTVPPADPDPDPEPEPECPEVIPPPPPPGPDGPVDRPTGDEESPPAPPQEGENDSSPDSSGGEEGPADRPDDD